MALSQDRNTPERAGDDFEFGVATATTIFAGGIVCLNATGYAVPGATATGLIPVGRAEQRMVNAGADGAKTIKVRRGVFRFDNSADSDAITRAEIGDNCWIVDDHTVAKTNGSSTRSIAGLIVDVDTLGVWVLLGYGLLTAPGGALLAANNLDDVGTAATARANLGTNKVYVPIHVATLVGTNVYRAVAPVAGTITKIWSVIEGVLTTGNATLTGKIGTDAITNGVVTVTQSGSAAGDVDSATPTAANAVEAGDEISLTVGGTNATATVARCLVEITF